MCATCHGIAESLYEPERSYSESYRWTTENTPGVLL
jgi:hypothetical protein